MNEVGSIVPSEDPAPVEQTEALPENSESAQVTAAPVASVESPQASESSQETVVAPEAAATEPLFVLPESDVDLTDVPDVALIDIDKLAEGTIAYRPEEELEESGGDMAEAKQDKKNKKKGKDVLESLQTALKQLTPEEQIATVMSKYGELAESNRQLRSSVKMIHKQVDNVQREKENMEAEHSKVILTKARLESLCRELQRQNKLIKEENVCRLREEEERRKEVSAKFNSTLSEISNLMKENSEKNNKLRDENQDMATRLQDLVKQYESRETHVEKILKAKDLQCQLVEAKLAKHHIEITENKEKMLLEKKGLLEDISTYQGKLQTMSETEITLRTQLNSYMEKYEEFQTTLDRSNKIFNTFKKEMDEMTKKIKKLEKETKTWKERWEGANKALLDMVAERSDLEKKMELQNRKNVQLQNLCRALQEQVTELRKQNKSLGGTEITTEIPNGEILTKEVSTETVTNAKEASTETVSQDIVVSTETVNETKESPIESPVESPIDDEDSGENLIDAIDVISEIVANSEHLLKEINLTGLSDNASNDVEKAAVSNVTSVVESAVDGNEQPVVANDTSNGTNSSEAVVTDFHDVD